MGTGGFNQPATLHAGGVLDGTGGAAPTIASGAKGVASTARNGAGDYSVTLAEGIGGNDCDVVITPSGALAASQLTTFGIVHVSATVKRITCLREGAAGAVSALTDLAFNFAIHRTRDAY